MAIEVSAPRPTDQQIESLGTNGMDMAILLCR
jgi:hypothetical protein